MIDHKIEELAAVVEDAENKLIGATNALGNYQVAQLKASLPYHIEHHIAGEFQIVICIYDVPKRNVEAVKCKARELIYFGFERQYMSILRVYSHEDTMKYYPEYIKKETEVKP